MTFILRKPSPLVRAELITLSAPVLRVNLGPSRTRRRGLRLRWRVAQVSRSVRRPMRVPQVSAFETWETTNLNRRVLASPNPPAASAPGRRRPLPLYLDGWHQTGRVMPVTRPRPIFRPCRQTARNRVRDPAIPGLNTRDLGHPLHGSAASRKAQGQEIVPRRIEWSALADDFRTFLLKSTAA